MWRIAKITTTEGSVKHLSSENFENLVSVKLIDSNGGVLQIGRYAFGDRVNIIRFREVLCENGIDAQVLGLTNNSIKVSEPLSRLISPYLGEFFGVGSISLMDAVENETYRIKDGKFYVSDTDYYEILDLKHLVKTLALKS